MAEEIVTLKELAHILGMSTWAVYDRAELFGGVKLGGIWRFKKEIPSSTVGFPQECLNAKEAAAILKITDRTLYKLAAQKILPARRMSKYWWFIKSEIYALFP